MLTITAFNYKTTYSLSTPSIRVSKVSTEKENVLCLQINISSLNYIDSLIVEPKNDNSKESKKVFVFKENTRRASVTYFLHEGLTSDDFKFSLIMRDDGKKLGFEKNLNINNI